MRCESCQTCRVTLTGRPAPVKNHAPPQLCCLRRLLLTLLLLHLILYQSPHAARHSTLTPYGTALPPPIPTRGAPLHPHCARHSLLPGVALPHSARHFPSLNTVLDPANPPPLPAPPPLHSTRPPPLLPGVAKYGQPLSLDDSAGLKVDLIVVGSSAVSRNGARLGKGEVRGGLC